MRPETALTALLVAAVILTVGFLFEQAWTTGIGIVLIGITFYLMFSKPVPLDSDAPPYGSPEAEALAEQRRQQRRARLPSAPFEGLGIMAVLIVCAVVLAIGFLFEQAWTTGIGIVMIGVLFAFLFRPKSRSDA